MLESESLMRQGADCIHYSFVCCAVSFNWSIDCIDWLIARLFVCFVNALQIPISCVRRLLYSLLHKKEPPVVVVVTLSARVVKIIGYTDTPYIQRKSQTDTPYNHERTDCNCSSFTQTKLRPHMCSWHTHTHTHTLATRHPYVYVIKLHGYFTTHVLSLRCSAHIREYIHDRDAYHSLITIWLAC